MLGFGVAGDFVQEVAECGFEEAAGIGVLFDEEVGPGGEGVEFPADVFFGPVFLEGGAAAKGVLDDVAADDAGILGALAEGDGLESAVHAGDFPGGAGFGEETEGDEAAADLGPAVFVTRLSGGGDFGALVADEDFEPFPRDGIGRQKSGVFEGEAFVGLEAFERGAEDGIQAAFVVMAAQFGVLILGEGVEGFEFFEAEALEEAGAGDFGMSGEPGGDELDGDGVAAQALDNALGGLTLRFAGEGAMLFEEFERIGRGQKAEGQPEGSGRRRAGGRPLAGCGEEVQRRAEAGEIIAVRGGKPGRIGDIVE